MLMSTIIEDIYLADVIAIYMIVADVITTKAEVLPIVLADATANFMIVADVIATKADVNAFYIDYSDG